MLGLHWYFILLSCELLNTKISQMPFLRCYTSVVTHSPVNKRALLSFEGNLFWLLQERDTCIYVQIWRAALHSDQNHPCNYITRTFKVPTKVALAKASENSRPLCIISLHPPVLLWVEEPLQQQRLLDLQLKHHAMQCFYCQRLQDKWYFSDRLKIIPK